MGPSRVAPLQPWLTCSSGSLGALAQTPSAVSEPELVIFLKRLAAHTPMKFFCKRGRGEMLILL